MGKLEKYAAAAEARQGNLFSDATGSSGVSARVAKPKGETVKMLVSLDADVKERLFQYAHKVRQSQSEVVRLALSEYLDRNEQEIDK